MQQYSKYNTELELQSVDMGKPCFHRCLICVKYNNNPNLELGLGTPHWHLFTLLLVYFGLGLANFLSFK